MAASPSIPPLQGQGQVPEGVKYLDAAQLEAFTAAFARWHAATRGQATRRSRGRVWCVYLVLRFTGARLQETLNLDDLADVDLGRAVVRFHGADEAVREVQLPEEAVRQLRAYLEDPEQASLRGTVFRLDQGHVRRKFQEVGQQAGLPRELANPTALRRSRAIELLRSGVPLPVVQQTLGQNSANLAASLVEFSDAETRRILGAHLRRENARRMSARNTFFGQVTRLRPGDIQTEVELTTLGGYPVRAVITNGSVQSMQLREGRYATAIVKAPWVKLARGDEFPRTSSGNVFAGTVRQVQTGALCAEVVTELPDGQLMCAVVPASETTAPGLAVGERVWVLFESLAVILLAE